IGTGVPKIVHGVELPATHIKPPCQIDERNSTDCDERELLVASVSPPVARHQQSNRQASKSKACPRKNREEPGLRFAQIMYAVDIRLERPRKPVRTPRCPKQRREQGDRQSDCSCGSGQNKPGAPRISSSPQKQPAASSHEHHGNADRVQNIYAKQIAPRRPAPSDQVFLRAKQHSQAENLRTAPNGSSSDLRSCKIFLPQLVDDQRERNACKEQKQRGRQRASQLRPHEKGALARPVSQPGVVA